MTQLNLYEVSVALGARRVLQNITFTSAPDDLIALLGPNGAGKTTLLRAIANLVPSRGVISFGDTRLSSLTARVRARLLAYMPQSGVIAWPMRVRDVIALGRIPHEGSAQSRHDAATIERAMYACDIVHLADCTIDRLSGGERVRVMLARTLAVDAPVLLLDEPVASLDPAQQLAVMDLLREEARSGKIVIVVLHDLTLAVRYATRAVLLSGGRLAGNDKPIALIERGDLGQAFGISIQVLEAQSGLSIHSVRAETA